MKVLVATRDGQGRRKTDFFHTIEGELVTFPHIECDGETVDGGCGCRRSMAGTGSLKASTTFKVEDRPMTTDNLNALLMDELKLGGWMGLMPQEVCQRLVETTSRRLCQLANSFPAGTVLERRGGRIQRRHQK